ncbi:hypothetical protein A2U01_0095484, partial [Trifolium medium]|nr:hypothetical protein [Trifolium medium]
SALQASPAAQPAAAQALHAKDHRDAAPPDAVETLHVRLCDA